MEEQNLDLFNKKVGTKEKTSLSAKPVKVVGLAVESVKGKKGTDKQDKEVGKKLILIVKHPDREETIKLSELKIQKGDSLKVSTIWVNIDEDNNIAKGSLLDSLMDFYKVTTLRELEGKEIQTILDNLGYLCVKAY